MVLYVYLCPSRTSQRIMAEARGEAVQDEGGWGALDNDSLVAGAAGGTSTLVVKCKVL